MRELKLKPKIQIWVCVNERSNQDLTSCQRDRGESVISALKESLLRFAPETSLGDIWINRTLCQGSCSAHGVSLVVEAGPRPGADRSDPRFSRRYAAVLPHDADSIVKELLSLQGTTAP